MYAASLCEVSEVPLLTMTENIEQTFAIACLTGFFTFIIIKLMIINTLREERIGNSLEDMRERVKQALTETVVDTQCEELQEDIRILKERIDSVCEADIQPLKHEMRMLFDHLLSVDGYTSNGPTKRDLLTYLQKKKTE